jgi:adenosine kinase
VFGNETEAAAWGAANGLGESADVSAVALAIAALPLAGGGVRTVVITQGAKQTVAAVGGAIAATVPVDPVANIVDVNGAGDAFVGGFLAATARGAPLELAVRVGHWAAGEVIQRSGCAFDAAKKCPLL